MSIASALDSTRTNRDLSTKWRLEQYVGTSLCFSRIFDDLALGRADDRLFRQHGVRKQAP